MALISASVEANGWVLRLVVSGALGSFASYALDPDGTPRLTLATSDAGFVQSGGQAVAGTRARTLVATTPLRLPVNPASPTTRVIDETDLGGGQIAVRIALSEFVYATTTSLLLTGLAGWRSGEGAFAGVAVTNNSTVAVPVPILRWARPSYDIAAGQFRVSLVAVSLHPNGYAPIAGVKFTATDGTTTKTVWTTALGTDNDYGDSLRCYTALIDPATATALTAGLLRIDAEVYPWLGAMRSTDPAGTKSLTNLRTDGYSVNAEAPLVVAYDPAGTRYGQMWTYVDPVNGTTTASAAMVQTSLAAAKGVAAASRPRDIQTAIQAGYLVNRTLAAANGQSSQTRSVDGMKIVLAPGTHAGGGSTAVTTGIATAEVPIEILGDPDDSNPRANVVWNTAAAATGGRVNRALVSNMTLGLGGQALLATNFTYLRFDGVTGQGKSGSESASTALTAVSPVSGQFNVSATRSKFWRYGAGITAGNTRCGLFRGNEYSNNTQSLCHLKNRWIGPTEDGFVGSAVRNQWQGWASATLAGQVEDIIVAFNDFRHARGRSWVPQTLPAATAGTTNPSLRRNVFLGNLCERIGSDPQPFYSIGEDTSVSATYNIIENNTHVGDRANTLYSDPVPTTLAECDSQANQALVNRVAGNAYDWWPTKHDDFNDPTTQSVRTANGVTSANGYRPQMVETWSAYYGAGFEGNFDTARAALSTFRFEYPGLRSVQNATGASVSPQYTSDASVLGTGAGGGNYVPSIASPLLNRTVRGNSDVDLFGTLRSGSSFSGALSSPAINVLPEGMTLPLSIAAPAVAGVAVATAEGMVLGLTMSQPTVTAAAGVAPAGMVFELVFAQAAVSATPSITVAPAGLVLAMTIGEAGVTAAAGAAPDDMVLGMDLAEPEVTATARAVPAGMIFDLSIGATSLTVIDTMWPVTLAEAKAWLAVAHTADDELIRSLVKAASDAIEAETGLSLRDRPFVFRYQGFPKGAEPLQLWRRPVTLVGSVDFVAAGDGAELAVDGSAFRPREQDNRAWLYPPRGEGWPSAERSKGSVTVNFNAGFADNAAVPEAVRSAVLRLVAHWYGNREEVAVGFSTTPAEIPLGIRLLLAPFRSAGVG